MKSVNKLILVATLAGSVSLLAGTAARLSESQQENIQRTIQKTPVVELAPQAVSLVSKSSASLRKETAMLVVRTAAKKSPMNSATVVSAVASVVPELAPNLVAIVAEVAPDQTIEAARVMAILSPESADAIVAAVGEVAPKSMAAVKVAVNEEKAAAAKVNNATSNGKTLANTGRAFPPGSGGKVSLVVVPINPRLKFPTLPPKDVANYAEVAADSNRQ